MSEKSSIQFLDLPVELQQNILWKCLEGWEAKLENHEKPAKDGSKIKETTRIWSSHIYDNLMLSLTCKYFYQTIQSIQRDSRLFSGDLDLIEANGAISYLLGTMWNIRTNYLLFGRAPLPYDFRPDGLNYPVPMFRTQLFIKAHPYDRADPNWRHDRIAYHAQARTWLLQHVKSLGVWFDELRTPFPLFQLPHLKHLTIYWPWAEVSGERLDSLDCSVCETDDTTLLDLIRACEDISSGTKMFFDDDDDEDSVDEDSVDRLSLLAASIPKLTLQLEISHLHLQGRNQSLTSEDVTYLIEEGGIYHKLDCHVTVEKEIWKVAYRNCAGGLTVGPMEPSDTDDE